MGRGALKIPTPETVPQACIDMTKVLEVTTAEDVTGHINSIAITGPDHVTFVKGTCSEESKWWLNILAAFPKSKGRHKRNATFPGTQATTILQSTNSDACSTSNISRNRHNSYHKDTLTSTQSTGLLNANKASSINVTEKNSISTSTSITTPATNTTTAATTIPHNSSNNGNSKLWSHSDLVTTTTAATTAITTKQATTTKTSATVSKSKRSLTTTTNTTVIDDDDEDDGVETGEDDDDEEEDEEVDEDEDDEDANSTGEECHTKDSLTTAVTSVCDENNRNVVNEIKNRVIGNNAVNHMAYCVMH
uniref:Protein outspread n=1 Tax=Glossina brevipalpis TaxID=37001 RepID=A0A1A9W086_9MUSC